MTLTSIPQYSVLEEKINVSLHIIGLLFSVIALLLMLMRSLGNGDAESIFSVTVFGVSMTMLYAASVNYHRTQNLIKRARLRVFDHAAIYLLIAGTYTPLTLLGLHSYIGWIIFSVSWVMALIGIILKIFFTGRYKLLSTLMYIFMGWIIIIAVKPLMHNVSINGVAWLIGGGIAYTLGAVLYAIKSIKFNHAIFHVLVVVGSFCHFITVYYYLLK